MIFPALATKHSKLAQRCGRALKFGLTSITRRHRAIAVTGLIESTRDLGFDYISDFAWSNELILILRKSDDEKHVLVLNKHGQIAWIVSSDV